MIASDQALSGFNPRRYPRTAAYIEQLPEGLDSFSGCTAKTAIHRTVYSHAGEALTELPAVLQVLVDGGGSAARWMPQCHTLALILAIVESRGLRGEAEAAWIREAASLLFSTPMYKILMWAASPRLLVRGADIRWSAFFRGSTLTAAVDDDEAELELIAPPGLFDNQLAAIFVDVLRAALTYAEYGASAVRLELVEYQPGRVRYHVSW